MCIYDIYSETKTVKKTMILLIHLKMYFIIHGPSL